MTGSDALWEEVADLELAAATLEAEIEAFHGEYLRAVGMLVAEVHELEARIAAASGDARAAAAAREDAARSRASVAAVPPPAPPAAGEELKALYRRAAKRLHPDLADEGARHHAEAFMKRLNAAYRARDAAAIADLLRQWEGTPAPGPAGEEAARLALEAAGRRLDELRESDVGRLLEASLQAALRGEDLLADLRRRWLAALADARARWAAVQGRRPG